MADWTHNNVIDWRAGIATGCNGGIPEPVDEVLVVAPDQGDLDATAAINDAVNQARLLAVSAGGLVRATFPTSGGLYRMDGGINFSYDKNNAELYGAPNGSTHLDCRGGGVSVINCGTGDVYEPGATVLSNMVKGGTSFTLSHTSNMGVGTLLTVYIENEMNNAAIIAGQTPVLSTGGAKNCRSLSLVITGINYGTNVVDFVPALYDNYTQAGRLAASAFAQKLPSARQGVSNIVLDLTNSSATFGVFAAGVRELWFRNVETRNQNSYGIAMYGCYRPEIRGCFFNGTKFSPGSNSAGLRLGAATQAGLYVHNRFTGMFPEIEINNGCAGSAFGYNYLEALYSGGFLYQSFIGNHEPHPDFTLLEGNIIASTQQDSYFGSSGKFLFHKNLMHGTKQNAAGTVIGTRTPFEFRRYNYDHIASGNLIGWPGQTMGPYNFGSAYIGGGTGANRINCRAGTFSPDWKAQVTLTTRTNDNAGEVTLSNADTNWPTGYIGGIHFGASEYQITMGARTGNVCAFTTGGTLPVAGTVGTFFSGTIGFPDTDDGVDATAIKVSNYIARDSEIPAGELTTLGADTLKRSYLYDVGVTPPEFTAYSLTFPPFTPTSPNFNLRAVPGGKLFLDGPLYTLHPTSQTLNVGDNVTFTTTATGTPTPTYQWKKGSVEIAGATSASYSITGLVSGDAGYFTCVATNAVGRSTSSVARLIVNAPPAAPSFTLDPVSQTVTVGANVTFTVVANGTPTPTYQWKKGGVDVSGAVSSSYSIIGVTLGSAGSYTCVATNTEGTDTSAAGVLTVNAAGSGPSPRGNRGSRTFAVRGF